MSGDLLEMASTIICQIVVFEVYPRKSEKKSFILLEIFVNFFDISLIVFVIVFPNFVTFSREMIHFVAVNIFESLNFEMIESVGIFFFDKAQIIYTKLEI